MRKILSFLMMTLFSASLFATEISVPATALDLQSPTMVTSAGWTGEKAYYLDDDVLVVSGYESYKAVAKQTWITFLSTGSSDATWDASAPFRGSSYYTTAKYATLQGGRYTAYLVTGCDSVWLYGKNNSASKYLLMNIYDVTSSDATSIDDTKVDATYSLKNTGTTDPMVLKQALDATKKYLVVTAGVGGSNSRVFEVAFFRHPASDPEPTTKTFYLKLSSDWASWPAKYAMYYFKSADNSQNGWSEFMTEVEGETNIYTGTIPVGYDKLIMVRLNGEAAETNWTNKWSQTADLDVPTNDNNLFTVTSTGTGDGATGTWSTYVPAKPAEDVTLYLINNQEWATPKAYVFTGSTPKAAWPGEAMTKTEDKVNDFDVYSFTFKDNFTSIIFNDGAAEGTIQTADLTWDKAKPYFVPGAKNEQGKFEGTWYATKEEIPAPPTPKYNIAGAWTNWALVELTVAQDGKTATYEAELPKGEYEFKIVRTLGEEKTWLTKENDGAYGLHREWTGVAGVTSTANNNLKVTADENGVYLFTWTFANDSIGITFPAKHALNEIWKVDENTAVAAGTVYVDNYAINVKSVYATTLKENARTFGGVAFSHAITVRNTDYPTTEVPAGTENSGNTSLVVTANEDVEITLFYNRQTTSNETGAAAQNDNKDLKVFDQAAPTTAMEGTFKVVWMQDDKKYVNATKTLSLTKGHVYTISAKGTTIQLHGIRYASDAVEPAAKFYISGNAALVGEALAWKANAIKSTEDSYTLNLKADTKYLLKVIEDGDWEGGKVYGYSNLTEKPEGLSKDNDDNIAFKLAEDGDVTVTFKVVEEVVTFKLEGNFYVAPKKDLYLVPNQWAEADAKIAAWVWDKDGKMDSYFTDFFAPKAENNDTLVAKVIAEADSIIFVRFNKDATEAKWNGGEGYQWNQTPDDSIQWDKAVFTILPGGDYVTNGTWDVYTPEPVLADGFYLIGQNGWDVAALNADLLFAANEGNPGEYQLSVTLVKDQGIKVVKVESDVITAWYPQGMDNEYKVDEAHAGAKTIYFKPEYTEAWAEFGGYFYIAPNEATAISNTTVESKTQKMIISGQLFILRDGKTYTAQGLQVK